MKFETGILAAKILGITLFSILICTLFIGALIYNVHKLDLEKSLRQSLEKLATTASLMVSGEIHKTIDSVESDEYKTIQSILQKVKKANNLDSPIYTLKRDLEKNKVKCVITTDDVYLLGATYKLKKEMLSVFNKAKTTSTPFYVDKTGTWVSSYAPIKDNDNRVVALLKVQHHAGYIFTELRSRLWIIITFCAIGFMVSTFLIIPLINPITKSIKELDDAAIKLETGDYDRKIDIRTNDEIGHLAKTFEHMRGKLRANIEKLQKAWINEKRAHLESILTLSRAIEIRDPYTKGHIDKVSEYAMLIGKEMGFSTNEIENLKYGCILHDLGKLDINIDILSKNSELDREETSKIRLHPEYGAEIIRGIEFLESAREIILYHHERYDGKGYPHGMKGDEIPLMARIVSLIDAFDAMTSNRPYRDGLSDDEAFAIISEESGRQFDPKICDLFLKLRPKILKVKNKFT